MEREALKLALEALTHMCEHTRAKVGYKGTFVGKAIEEIEAALAQPAHSEWNAALDEAAARIGEIKGFGQATQDSFAAYIKGLKR